MVATIRVEQFIHRSQLFPQFDAIHLPFLVDTDEIPKDPSAGSGFGLALDKPGYFIPTTFYYGISHWTAPGTAIPSDPISLLTGKVFFHFVDSQSESFYYPAI
jgi:hypothetical protein